MMRRIAQMPRDSGAGMVVVLAAIFLTAMLTTTILVSTTFSIRQTTASRANIEAVAAAEAGAQFIVQGLRNADSRPFDCRGEYSHLTHPVLGSDVEYEAEVFYKTEGGSEVQGCPPEDVDELRVVAIGYAKNKGVSNASRDIATTEVLFKRPKPDPRFNKALFGDLNMNINTALKVTPSDGDLFTNDTYTCSSNTEIAGDLYVGGDGVFSSAPCTVDGSVIIEGNFTCGGGLTIGGDLRVLGDVLLSSATCQINGSLWVGGDVTIPNGGTPIGGDLLVRGDLSVSGLPSIGGIIRVTGQINNNSGLWFDQLRGAYPDATWGDGAVPVPPPIPPSPDNVMPHLQRDDKLFDGWVTGNWVNALNSIRKEGPSSCSAMTWGDYEPLVVNSDTIFDTIAECGGSETHLGANFTIVLNADAVIFARSFKFGGDLRIESGDGEEHTLYLVVPWPAGQVDCTSSGGSTTFSYGSWTQDNLSKVLVYAPNRISVTSAPQLRGQLYACNIDAQTAFTVRYAPAGDQVVVPGVAGLKLNYMRDVTG